MVIPVPTPLGGALVVGESVIAYMAKGVAAKVTPIKPTTIKVGNLTPPLLWQTLAMQVRLTL